MANRKNPKPSNTAIPMSEIEKTLAERGARYGKFSDHARAAQHIQHAMEEFKIYHVSQQQTSYRQPWKELPPVMQRALTTIADKIARILNGDPMYDDNWHDIQGYAKLVEDWILKHKDQNAE